MTSGITRVTKVRYDAKAERVELRYEVANGDEWDTYELSTKDKPHPDLLAALQELRPHLLALCELTGIEEDEVEVRGVSITWKHDVMGCVITGLRALKSSQAPLVLNTPHKTVEPYSEKGGADGLLGEAVVAALEDLITEARAFAGGKRGDSEQAGLFEAAPFAGELAGV